MMKKRLREHFLSVTGTGLAVMLGAFSALAQKNDSNFSNVEDVGFDEMDSEAARLSDPDNTMEDQASPFDAEFKNEMPDLPDNNAGGTFDVDTAKAVNSKSRVEAPAATDKKSPLQKSDFKSVKPKPAVSPKPKSSSEQVVAPLAAPPVQTERPGMQPMIPAESPSFEAQVVSDKPAALQSQPEKISAPPTSTPKPVNIQNTKPTNPQPVSQQPVAETPILPTSPAAVVPKISGENDVSGTPENTAMEAAPEREVAPQTAPLPAKVTPAQTNATANPTYVAPPAQTAVQEGRALPVESVALPVDSSMSSVESIDREGQSPGPDQGPTVKELIPMNEFGGAPALPGARRIMAEGEAPEEYQVDPGDTLFDICDQLIDDPGYWPKLWALNPEIANPHFIYPGMKLRFYPGDDEMPPFLQVVSEDELVPVDNAELNPQQLVVEDIDHLLYREKLSESNKVAILPPEFVTDEELRNVDISQEFEDVGSVFIPTSYSVLMPSFVYESELAPLAIVKSGSTGELLVDANAKVLLKSEEGAGVSAGSLYTVVRAIGPIQRPMDGGRVGYRYDFIAQIKVTGVVGDATIGEVVFNRLGLQPGDLVTNYVSVQRKVPMAVSSAESVGGGNQVLAFEDPNSVLGGNRSLVLIDNSKGDFTPGSTILMYQDTNRFQSRFIQHKIPNLSRVVAKVHIIDNSTKVAIGMIVDNFGELYVGDYAGSPSLDASAAED